MGALARFVKRLLPVAADFAPLATRLAFVSGKFNFQRCTMRNTPGHQAACCIGRASIIS